ncbi:MAG TPA: dihydrolipoyl dehydrogenase [Bacteroidetes bacterium]|nr:dihydrolipoyl dehydrogenase [Bacteroidota bacterium]
MSDKQTQTQLAVIGSGPGGYAAAFLAADLGMDVTLIDTAPNPGGVCLYRGCIPSKALLHVAKLLSEAKEAKNWGISFSEPKIDLPRLREWKNSVVAQLTGGLGRLSKQRKVNFIRGKATFNDSQSLKINTVAGAAQKLIFQQAVLATGSHPVTLPGVPVDSPLVMDSSAALALETLPKSMLVVGGGYIGLELGTVYASLGTKVTVVEMLPGLLPGADRDLIAVLAKKLNSAFTEIMLETTVKNIRVKKNGVSVQFQTGNGTELKKDYEKVLIAVGRKPNSANLGLENTKVQTDEKWFVKVDAQRRTGDPAIFAIGDVAGEPMLAHKAAHEGRTAVEVIAGGKSVFEPRAIPAVVFTDPELAWCGLTESEAKKQKREVSVTRFPWAASGRAATLGRSDGLTKIIFDSQTERVLGVGIVGPGAGELISEAVLAVEMAAVAKDLELTIHPHPTLSETVMESAAMLFGTGTHIYRPKRKR